MVRVTESNVAPSVVQRLALTLWWFGFPFAMVIWILVPRESTIYVSFEPFSIEANTLQTLSAPRRE